MGASGIFCANRHDVARTGSISADVASPQFNFDSNGNVAAAGASGTVVSQRWPSIGLDLVTDLGPR